MDGLTVLITGSGAPGIQGTLYSLKNNYDNRDIKTIGTDIEKEVIGKYLCDVFYCISRPSSIEYLEQLLSICERESVDVILPQNTAELLVLARNKKQFKNINTEISVSDENAITIANDKYNLMKIGESIGIPVPRYYLVDNYDALIQTADRLGWPNNPIVVKPPISNGMRGVRIIDETIDLKKNFYSEKPDSLFTKMDHLCEVLGPKFPPLIAMEYLSNDEYSIDVLKTDRYTVIPRKRDLIRSGITFNGTLIENDEISDYCIKLSDEIGLEYAFGFQFKEDHNNVPKLIESNPRIQGTMVLSTFGGANIIYSSVKHSIGEIVPDFRIKWGTRILRYWGGMGIIDEVPVVTI